VTNYEILSRIWELQKEVKEWGFEHHPIRSAIFKLQEALSDAEKRIQDEIHGKKTIQ
jgi:hypothetical protein